MSNLIPMTKDPRDIRVPYYRRTWRDKLWFAVVPRLPTRVRMWVPSYRRLHTFVWTWLHGGGLERTGIAEQLALDPKIQRAFGRCGSVLEGFRLILGGDELPEGMAEMFATPEVATPTTREVAGSVISIMSMAQRGTPFRE